MKITKATIKRINANSNAAIFVIGEILCRSAVILGSPGSYELNDGSWEILQPLIFSDGDREVVSGRTSGDYEAKIVRGLTTKYPRWISGTLTHGLNGVDIYDVNKLVKAISEEW